MIEKERLQELIEQEETIWCVSELWGSNKLKLHNKDVRDSDCFHISKTLLLSDSIEFYDEEETYKVPFQLLFETEQEYLKHKEEAEWVAEFGCIERTERLNITDWQKFKNRDENFGFTVEDCSYKCFTDGIEIKLVEFWGQGGRSLFKAPLTKENYTIACRKAKELFLGENK